VDVSKSEIILTCLNSLMASLNDAKGRLPQLEASIHVIDDHSDETCVRGILHLLNTCPFETSMQRLDTKTGNGASLAATYDYARKEARDLIYFVEDDYLHSPSALFELLDAHARLNARFSQSVILFPCDYPDRYAEPYPTLITLGCARYWRSVLHTTGTLFVARETLEKYWEVFLRFAQYGIDPGVNEDNTINRIYRETPCFSPIPSLTVHMASPESMSPFIDWKAGWEMNRLKPESFAECPG
jgi:hypothetical protein